jgi:histidine triad (HIT) family protein
MKKWFFAVFFLVLLILSFFWIDRSFKVKEFHNCPFCNEKILEIKKFAENNLAVAILDHNQTIPGHCLVIPKRHIARFDELTPKELSAIGELIKTTNAKVQHVFQTSAYLIMQRNGPQVGQKIFHVHFHYLPRKEQQLSYLTLQLLMMYSNLSKPISEEKSMTIVEKLRKAPL